MAGDASSLIAELPPWLQWGASASLFVVTTVAGLAAIRVGHKRGKAEDDDGFDADKLLDASPIRRFLEAVDTLADNAKIQTLALKTIAAAAAVQAKKLEPTFDEGHIERDTEMRLTHERILREARA